MGCFAVDTGRAIVLLVNAGVLIFLLLFLIIDGHHIDLIPD